MACVSICALLELLHLASLPHFVLMPLWSLELLLHSPSFRRSTIPSFVVIEDLGVDL